MKWQHVIAISTLLLMVGCVMLFVLSALVLPPKKTISAASAVTPTPDIFTCRTLFREYNARTTDLQKSVYTQALIGKSIVCRGTITNVTSDGSVYFSTEPMPLLAALAAFDFVIARGVPSADAVKFKSGDGIALRGIIESTTSLAGLRVRLKFESFE